MARILVIANPVSGRGAAQKLLPLVEPTLGEAGHEVRVRLTERAGQACEFAAGSDAQWADALVSIGGDGTLNEVINGRGQSEIAVGIVPLGTGNVAAKEFRIPQDPQEALRTIAAMQTREIDLGDAGKAGLFVCMLSAGVDAQIVKRLKEERQGAMKMRDYLPLVWREMKASPTYSISVEVDGKKLDKTSAYVNCANTRCYGGPLEFVSQAKADDGHLDLLTLDCNVRTRFLLMLFGAMMRQFHRVPGASVHKVRQVSLQSDGPVPFQIDGEYRGELPVEISIREKALKIIV